MIIMDTRAIYKDKTLRYQEEILDFIASYF